MREMKERIRAFEAPYANTKEDQLEQSLVQKEESKQPAAVEAPTSAEALQTFADNASGVEDEQIHFFDPYRK